MGPLTSAEIKSHARTLGFDACGIAPVADHPELDAFRKWLESKGVENIENVNAALEPATPWFSFYGAKSAHALG